MSYIGSQVKMLFGGPGDDTARASAGANHQLIPELLAAGTIIGRAFVGPQEVTNAVSVHAIVGAGTAPVGTLTLWESNLPNPDPAIDAHWVQNAGFTAVDLAVVANTFRTVVTSANSVRLKVARTSGTISLIVWVKSPGA
jgi:hypothetical protein